MDSDVVEGVRPLISNGADNFVAVWVRKALKGVGRIDAGAMPASLKCAVSGNTMRP